MFALVCVLFDEYMYSIYWYTDECILIDSLFKSMVKLKAGYKCNVHSKAKQS